MFLPDKSIVLTLGDSFEQRAHAQDIGNHTGTIIRITDSGGVPSDNPFVATAQARGEVFSYGHRNAQAVVYDEQNNIIYAHEHGAQGGDELNRIEAGKNYGWPVITHGRDYNGALISPYTHMEGMEQPLIQWTPSIAPSGMTLYQGDLFPQWRGDIFVTSLVFRDVRRLSIKQGEVVGEEKMFGEIGERLRDIRTAPDGSLYILAEGVKGALIHITP